MALHSLTRQDIFNSRYKEAVYSGERTADRDATVGYIEGYQLMSRCFEGIERHNVASDEPDSVADHRASNNPSKRLQLIDNLVASMQVRASQEMPLNLGVRSLNPLMEWEGSVEGIEGDEFVARLCNVTTGELLPTEAARFPVSDLNDVQRENLEVGAIFRWVIGLQRLPNGNKQRVSELFFRRLPAHSENEINATVESFAIQLDAREWDDAPSR
ncbi:MAG: hypothetical protein F4145_03740 [Boseongicola sp. SB0675_bin_26]|nr:hypothetical protein [Boseongicola sp. SB0675_bin_26]